MKFSQLFSDGCCWNENCGKAVRDGKYDHLYDHEELITAFVKILTKLHFDRESAEEFESRGMEHS